MKRKVKRLLREQKKDSTQILLSYKNAAYVAGVTYQHLSNMVSKGVLPKDVSVDDDGIRHCKIRLSDLIIWNETRSA